MTNKKEETPQEVSLAPTVAQENQIGNFNAETLIAKAIDQQVPVETMEKLLAMRRELKAEWAKEEFNRAMAKFQSECPTIKKTNEVKTNTGASAYHYAPFESIVEQVKTPLATNGFSYSTDVEVLEAGVKSTIKVTHIAGHSEQSTMEVPLGNKTNIMSASQVTAAASTFAKRYAFCNAFGILTGDEDNDAQAPAPVKGNPWNAPVRSSQLSSPKPTKDQLDQIERLMEEKGINGEQVNKWGFSGKDLTKAGANLLIDTLKVQKDKETPLDTNDGDITEEDLASVNEN